MNVLQVLIGARDRLANGWCQRRLKLYQEGGMQFCAVGAILDAATEDIFGSKDFSRVAVAAVAAQLPRGHWDGALGINAEEARWMRVVVFNNASATSQESILALFDRAIASLQPAKEVIAQAQNTDLITNEIQQEETA